MMMIICCSYLLSQICCLHHLKDNVRYVVNVCQNIYTVDELVRYVLISSLCSHQFMHSSHLFINSFIHLYIYLFRIISSKEIPIEREKSHFLVFLTGLISIQRKTHLYLLLSYQKMSKKKII